jgi:putative aldouronate transport system substrate-binding protein
MANEYWTEYQRLTHSKLSVEWVDAGSFHDVNHLRIASGDLPEVSGIPDVRTPTLLNAIKNGAYWDLTDYFGDFSQYPNLRDNVAENCYTYLSVNNRIYAAPRSRTRIDLGVNIRKDWLDKLGLPLPTTLDEYADALEAIVNSDPDGNGQKDTIGLLIDTSVPGSLGVAFGALDPQYTEDGAGIYHMYLNDGYIDTVAYLADLYKRGAISPQFASTKIEDNQNYYSTNRGASYIMSIWHHWEWETSSAKVQPDPAPKVVSLVLDGPKGKAIQLNTGVSGGYYVSKNVPEEKMIRILKYLEDATSMEVTNLAYYGIEGVHHTLKDGMPVLNELGTQQINTSSKCVGPLAYMKYGKVDSAGGDKAYNEEKRKMVEDYEEIGKTDFFGNGTVVSEVWNTNWPKYQSEYLANVAKAISNDMTVEDFRSYVEGLRSNPDLQPAWAEFSASWKAIFG